MERRGQRKQSIRLIRWSPALVVAVVTATAAACLVSCPHPMNKEIFRHVKDEVPPRIVLDSPAEGSSYGATVVVDGAVTDSSSAGEDGEVRSLSYAVIPATLPGGNVPFQPNGSFTLKFETHDFAGPMIVRFEAEDWNGNRGSADLNLVDQGAIPSFTAAAGSKSVTLSWDPVPLSAGYSLYYTDDATLPTAYYGEKIDGVESPFALEDLGNGRMHTFLLQSHSREGRDNWSEYVKAVPLSPMTLAPTVTGEYGGIQVEWWPIPATTEFDVLRATQGEGPYETIAAGAFQNGFVDTAVHRGTTYWYKVRPSMPGCIESIANAACLAAYPAQKDRMVGSCTTVGPALDVSLRGAIAFVAAGEAGLVIVDVSNPRAPAVVSLCDTPGSAWEVELQGDHAFVADNTGGLQVIDVSDLYAPAIAGSYVEVDKAVYSVDVAPGYVYTAGTAGVHVLDVSKVLAGDPSPVLGTYLYDPGGWVIFPPVASHVEVRGDTAYTLYSGLRVLDVSNPAGPSLLGLCSDIETTQSLLGVPQGMCLQGELAFAADAEYGFKIIDVSAPDLPTLIASCDTPGTGTRVFPADDRIYVCDGTAGLQIFDVTDPVNPVLTGACDTPDLLAAVQVAGGYAYAADGGSGLLVIDLLSAGSLSGVGSVSLPNDPNAVAVRKNYAYVGAGEPLTSGPSFWVLDVEDPENPAVRGSCDAGYPVAICISGRHAFVGTLGGLSVVDILDPLLPNAVNTYSYAASMVATDVVAHGACLLASMITFPYGAEEIQAHGLLILDISEPDAPEFLAMYDLQGFAGSGETAMIGVAVKESLAFVTDMDEGMHVVDISDPVEPRLLASMVTSGRACDVEVRGDYAIVADDDAVRIIDVSDPRHPETMTACDVPAQRLAVRGGYAFAVDPSFGLSVIDISNPEAPVVTATYQTPGSEADVAVWGDHAFIAGGTGGAFEIVDLLPGP